MRIDPIPHLHALALSICSPKQHPSAKLNPMGPLAAALGCALSLTGCFGVVSPGESSQAKACTPGESNCVCEPTGGCQPGLLCIADRCITLESTGLPRPSKSNTRTNGKSTQPATSPEPSGDTGGTEGSGTAVETSNPGDPEPSACNDGQRNFRETDVDCGGPVCTGCALNQHCRGDIDCLSKVCVDQRCTQCESDSDCDDFNPCTSNRCQAGRCNTKPIKNGVACSDKNPCTAQDRCNEGRCQGKDTLVLAEDFDDGPGGWRAVHQDRNTRPLWEVKPAQSSNCAMQVGQDPAQDHTQKGKNGVAGVRVGGCQARRADRKWDCFWSPDVDISFFDEPVVFSFWRHLHSPAGDVASNQGVASRIVYRVNKSAQSESLEDGYGQVTNDAQWTHRLYTLEQNGARSVAFGICYRKSSEGRAFAGWTFDDVKIRQKGCLSDK